MVMNMLGLCTCIYPSCSENVWGEEERHKKRENESEREQGEKDRQREIRRESVRKKERARD